MNAAVRSAAISAILLADFGFSAGWSADLTAREVTTRLYEAGAGTAIDLSSRDLRFLDLSGLDFKAARLSGSDLYGTDFTDARLAGSDLTHTRLDRSVLIRADFSGANLAGSTILRPTVFSTPSFNLADAPKFAGANLRGVRFMAHFEGADFRGADLSAADLSPFEPRAGQKAPSTAHGNVMKSCDFSGARLPGADLTSAVLTFSRMHGVDLRRARLVEADLSRVDLTGADLTGADLTGADFDGTILTGAKGLDTAVGLAKAVNFDRAVR